MASKYPSVEKIDAIIDELGIQKYLKTPSRKSTGGKIEGVTAHRAGRNNSDEAYIIGLCDEVLGKKAFRQHRFPFLTGDSGRTLPVDAYYPSINLVIEYYESQHTESGFFDHKDRLTVSGVDRGVQRRIYDERRRIVLPKHGIKLVVINYTDFGTRKKLLRNHDRDLEIVKSVLISNGIDI